MSHSKHVGVVGVYVDIDGCHYLTVRRCCAAVLTRPGEAFGLDFRP